MRKSSRKKQLSIFLVLVMFFALSIPQAIFAEEENLTDVPVTSPSEDDDIATTTEDNDDTEDTEETIGTLDEENQKNGDEGNNMDLLELAPMAISDITILDTELTCKPINLNTFNGKSNMQNNMSYISVNSDHFTVKWLANNKVEVTVPESSDENIYCIGFHLSSYYYIPGSDVQQNGEPYPAQTLYDDDHGLIRSGESRVFTVDLKNEDCEPAQIDLYSYFLHKDGTWESSFWESAPHHGPAFENGSNGAIRKLHSAYIHIPKNVWKCYEVKPLTLTSVCTDQRDFAKFRVTNPNSFDVDFEFENVDLGNGKSSATAIRALEGETEGYTYFYVESAGSGSSDTTKIYWQSNKIEKFSSEKSTTKASGGKICQYEVTIEKKWFTSNGQETEAPGDVEWEVLITVFNPNNIEDNVSYKLNNETQSVTFKTYFDWKITIDEPEIDGFLVTGLGTFDREDIYPEGPLWTFKGEGKYYSNNDNETPRLTVINTVITTEDPGNDTPPGGGGGGGTPPSDDTPPVDEGSDQTSDLLDEVVIIEPAPAAPQQVEEIVVEEEPAPAAPQQVEEIVIEEEPAPALPNTGGNTTVFYLLGFAAFGIGLGLRKKDTNHIV